MHLLQLWQERSPLVVLPETLEAEDLVAVSPEADLKSLVAEVVATTLDAQQVAEKLEGPNLKRIFRPVDSETHYPS